MHGVRTRCALPGVPWRTIRGSGARPALSPSTLSSSHHLLIHSAMASSCPVLQQPSNSTVASPHSTAAYSCRVLPTRTISRSPFPVSTMSHQVVLHPTTAYLHILPRHSYKQNFHFFQQPQAQSIHNFHSEAIVVPSDPFVSDVIKRTARIQSRQYSLESGSSIETVEDEEGSLSDSEYSLYRFSQRKLLDKEKFDQLRVNLYPTSNDSVLKALHEASSIQQVFDQVEKCGDKLSAVHISQTVVTLWDLQKMYGCYGTDYSIVPSSQINEFLDKIATHPVFGKLVATLECNYEDLNNSALACTLLYLYKIGVKNDTALMQKLVLLSMERLEQFNLSALSRLSVYLHALGHKSYFLQSKVLPVAADKLCDCTTCDEIYKLTICLKSAKRILTESLMDDYIRLIVKKFDEGLFQSCEPKIMLKIVELLTFPEWSSKRNSLSQRLMLCSTENINSLSVDQVLDLGKCFRNYLEPREVLQKIQQYAFNLIDEASLSEDRLELLCLAPFTSPKLKNYYEELLVEHLDRKDMYEFIWTFFRTLRHIKTSNFKLCNAFWNKSMHAVETAIANNSELHLGEKDAMRRKVYQCYMYFNNNLGGTYRNHRLERQMSALLLEDINTTTGCIPSKLASMSSFLLSYSSRQGLTDTVVDRLLEYEPQFSIFDTLQLSRGIEIALALNASISRTLMEQVTALTKMLDNTTEQHLKRVKSLVDLTIILRGYLSRHKSPQALLFEQIMAAYTPLLSQLNSRHVHDICLYLTRTHYLVPQLLDKVTEYISEHSDYIHVETAAYVLTCLYHLGHHPPQHHQQTFFNTCTTAFAKDGQHMRSLNKLQMCLALNMFGRLPPHMIHSIFNISFMDQLDEEFAHCYLKNMYPMRVRHLLMELNRAVCLDHPEENIPWFHEKFCQELLHTMTIPSGAFHSEVHEALIQLVGGPEVLRVNVHTPYYYLINFEFVLDEKNQPVPVREYASGPSLTKTHQNHHLGIKPGYRRIAVLVRGEGHYCTNARLLLGRHQVEHRHLEILGYEVLEVPHFRWFSMALSTTHDKFVYIRRLIFPSLEEQEMVGN